MSKSKTKMTNVKGGHLTIKSLKKGASASHLRRSHALFWLGVRRSLAYGRRTLKAADLKITPKPQREK